MTRPIVATLMNVSSAMGKIMKRGSKSFQPPEGNQRSQSEKIRTRTGAMTKDGKTLPRLPSSITLTSIQEFCRRAARLPKTTPMTSESAMAVPPIVREIGSASATRSFTDQSA